jgi:chromosome segregation ATPase
VEGELTQTRQSRDELEQQKNEGASELEDVRAELEEQSQEHQRTEADLRAKLEAVNSTAEQSANALREKEEECTRLQGELAWANEIRDELERHKQSSAEELDRAKAEFQQQCHERERVEEDLRKHIDVSDSAAESTASALKEQEGRLMILESELVKVRRARDEFEQLQIQAATELERVRTELQQLGGDLREWESECQKLTNKNQSLNQELARMRETGAARPASGAAAKTNAGQTVKQGQLFRLRAPSAIQVYLAGDFTRWREAAIPMQKGRDGVWTTTIDLPPGTYNYLFIVDREWCVDPECPTKAPNQFGGQNSIRRIA